MKLLFKSIFSAWWIVYLVLFAGQEVEVEADAVRVVELTTSWKLTNQNGCHKEMVLISGPQMSLSLVDGGTYQTITRTNLKIPTGVYSALGGEEVLFGKNDVDLRWIAYDNWTYTRTFAFNKADFNNVRAVNLTFSGIDTVAEIRLNHYLVGRTDNMFVRYSYDVYKYLEEDNLLEVEITSPVYAAKARADALLERNVTVPPNCPNARYHGECHMNMLRKMQASFAWDWGLAAPSMGIWKSVALEYYEVAVIRDVDVVVSKNSSHWTMSIRVFMDTGLQQDFYADLTFYAVELLSDPVNISWHRNSSISYRAAFIEFQQAIPIANVVEWWPNGYGEQKLYPLHFTLNAWLDKSGPNFRAKSVSQKSIRIGFRTVELVQDALGDGNSFYFRVNGVPVFMKGTNYIPSHILPELGADTDRIKHLLQSAKDAHMNMLRVWGGGIYESDYFYDLADTLGIFIWQDMMFACAMYPVTEDFLASVRLETVQNAKRIGHHPSIAIFATNNENEVALAQNWYSTFYEQERFAAEYRELYVGNVLHELKLLESSARPDPLVSSPSNGVRGAQDNYLSADPQDPNYGDIHFYDIFKDGWDPSIYPRPRFASEYGFQSLPMMTSWLRSMNASDSLIDMMSHRQHHPMAMLPITLLVQRHLPLPLSEDENYAEALIYFSQIGQAMATKVETELYRSLRDTEHQTMGALYWQLNDVWVAPSWSSIDFYGNYKLLHYWAKDFLAPTAIVALYDKSLKTVNVSLICDELNPNTTNLAVTRHIYLWSSLYPQNSTTWPVTLVPNGVQYDKVIPLDEVLTEPFTQYNCFMEFVLHRDSTVLSRTHYFPNSINRAVGMGDPELKVDISWQYCISSNSLKMNAYSLTITVKRPAVFVFLEVVHESVTQYKLSRNGYVQVLPVQVVHLEIELDECVDLGAEHIKVLTVNQFMKNYDS